MDRGSFLDKMARAVDLSTEPTPGKPLVEIVGDQSVLIENHCGVISYSTQCIRVKTKQGCICISGSGLVLKRLSREQLKISGTIINVELHGRRS